MCSAVTVQCEFRKEADRAALHAEWGTAEDCKRRHRLGAARDAFKASGWQPFVKTAFSLPKFAPLLGNRSVFSRLHGDPLHLVRLCYSCSIDISLVSYTFVTSTFSVNWACLQFCEGGIKTCMFNLFRLILVDNGTACADAKWAGGAGYKRNVASDAADRRLVDRFVSLWQCVAFIVINSSLKCYLRLTCDE